MLPQSVTRWLQKCVRRTETGSGQRLSTAVAKYYFKLMAYKDEYEEARLYTNGDF
jgi:indolepyruvate ferredoxin oxidoreductase